MKILHIINGLIVAGAETLLCRLATILSMTHQVDVLTLNDVESPLKDKLLNAGIGYSSLNNHRYSPKNIFGLRDYLSQYDTINVHLFPSMLWTSMSLRFIPQTKRPKSVLTLHTTLEEFSQKVPRFIANYIFKRYSAIVAVSNTVADSFTIHYPEFSDKLHVIENGIDYNLIKNAFPVDRTRIGCKEDDIILLMVAGFRKSKDQSTLIHALTLLPENYIAVFAGGGDLAGEKEQHAEKLGVFDRCRFLGSVDNVPELLKTADIVVCSSFREGFGLAAIESMAAGKPPVASDIKGFREVIGDAGIFFQVGNSHDLAKKILQLRREKSFCQDLSRQCISRASYYSIERMCNEYDKLYNQLMHTDNYYD